jgi:glycerol-3-phosphate dehydrogenase
LLREHAVTGAEAAGRVTTVHTSRGDITARWVINAVGLGADWIDQEFGYHRFTVTPRRGELLVFDKLARPLAPRIVLPVPSSRGKGGPDQPHHLRQRDARTHFRRPPGPNGHGYLAVRL